MVRPDRKDMIVELVPTSDGAFPYIPAQDWVESEEDWVENGKDNPMTIEISQYDELVGYLETSDKDVSDNLQALKQAVENMEQLLDNSIYYITPAQPVSMRKERD